LNSATGKYEGTIGAPNITSYNINSGRYYPVRVEAEDLAGNKTIKTDTDTSLGSKLKLFVKEVTKPTITFTTPASGAYITSNVPEISFQLRDEVYGSGIKPSSLRVTVDGDQVLNNTSPGITATSVTGGYNVKYIPEYALSDGNHTIKIDVDDNDGNSANQVTRSFTIDTVPPNLTVDYPAEGTTYQNTSSINVLGVTNDATSSPVTISIKLNNSATVTVTPDGYGNFSKSLTLVEGTNTIVVTATDKAGKTSSVERTIILDTLAPMINNVTISPNPVNVGQSYNITVEVTD
jgi:hypothetical protein